MMLHYILWQLPTNVMYIRIMAVALRAFSICKGKCLDFSIMYSFVLNILLKYISLLKTFVRNLLNIVMGHLFFFENRPQHVGIIRPKHIIVYSNFQNLLLNNFLEYSSIN